MDFLTKLLDTAGFPARWYCGHAWYAEPHVGWMHIVSDVVIFFAYIAIPCVLAYFVLKRKELVFPNIFWLFALFIVSCGVTHLVEAMIFWEPVYRLSALLKMITAVVSTATVVALVRIAPQAIALPGLAEINQQLVNEVQTRSRAETDLKRTNEDLRRFTDNVMGREERVLELKNEVNVLLAELGRERRYGEQG